MDTPKKFKWDLKPITQPVISNMDLRIVSLPVKAVFEHSDKIIADYDHETDTVLEYTSGYVMKVVPNQEFVYRGEESLFLAQVREEPLEKSNQPIFSKIISFLENSKRSHHYCEDCWYSCPQHPEGCCDHSKGPDCDCGADEYNESVDELISELKSSL